MNYLLDTNVVSEWVKPRPDAKVARWLAEADEDRISLSVVTYQQSGKQYVAVASGRPSRFWIDQNPGSPTIFLFALP